MEQTVFNLIEKHVGFLVRNYSELAPEWLSDEHLEDAWNEAHVFPALAAVGGGSFSLDYLLRI